MFSKTINTVKRVTELETELEKLKHEVKNSQQVAHLKGYLFNRLQTKYDHLVKECSNLEKAFENYVNQVETEKMAEEIAVEEVRKKVRVRMAS